MDEKNEIFKEKNPGNFEVVLRNYIAVNNDYEILIDIYNSLDEKDKRKKKRFGIYERI